MADAHKNLAVSAVATAPSPPLSGTTLVVTTGQGTRFPATPFNATVWATGFQPDPTNAEIVRVTNITGDTLTISRAEEGTSARAIVVGDQIAATITAKTLTDAEAPDGIQGVAASDTTYSSGTISLTGVGGGVTVSSNTGQRIDISVAAQSIQPETQTFIGGVSASDTLYTSGSVRLTGVGGGITVSSNTGQRIDLSVAAPVAQTVQTQNVVDLTLAGNTAGALALISSGTATLAGGNNITLSQAGNAITISGAAGGVQTAISGIANSQTTYTSGTVSLSVVAGNLTIRSTTGQAFQFSASQSVQPETQTAISGLANSQTTYTSGTVSLSELGAITIRSTTGNQFQLSVNAQTTQTQGILSAGVSTGGNTAGNTQVSTGSRFVLVGTNMVSLSQGTAAGASTVTIDATNQNLSVGASTGGNTAGNTTVNSGSRLVFVGSNNITVSQGTAAGATTLTISGPSVAGAQTGISGIANSQTTYTSGTVSLSELGAVTIRSTTGQQYQISVNSQTVQTQGILSAGVSTGGNTAGNTQVSTGSRFVLVGSGNLTASQGTAAGATTVTLSVAAQSVQPETQTAISGIANSQTTYTSGTVSLSELGAITIRSTTGNQFQLSVNSQTVQTQNLHNVTLSGNTAGVMAQISSGTMTLAGGNNVTLSQAGNAVTISAGGGAETQTAISGISASNTLYTSGTVLFTGSNMITVKSSAAGQTVILDATQSVQTQDVLSIGVSTGGNTAGNTTVNTGSRFVVIGSGNLTASMATAAGATSLNLSVAAQSAQTGISAISNSNTTFTSGTIGLSELGAITIRSTTGNQFQFSVNSQTAQTGISALSNSNTTFTSGTVGLSELGAITIRSTTGNQFQFSVNSQTVQTQGILNVALSNIGNTAGDTGINSGTRMVLAGGNNITLSASTAAGATTVTISAPNLGAGAMSAGVSNLGNTAGSTGVTGTQLVLVGTNMVSLSQSTGANGGTVSINATQSVQTQGVPLMGVSTGGATSGDTTVNSGTRFVLVGTNLTMSQGTAANATTVTVSAPATSSLSGSGGIEISTNGSTISIGYGNNLADWQNMPSPNATLLTHVSGISKTPFYWNDHIDGDLTAQSLAMKISMVTASQPLSVSVHLGVYTFVNATSASRLASHSEAYVVSSATSVSLSGVRNLIMTGIGTHATLSTMSAGEYMFGLMFSATATNAMNFSLMGANSVIGAFGGLYPGTNNVSAGTSQGIQALQGRGSTTVNAMPPTVQASELVNYGQGASMALHPWLYIRS